MAGELVVSDGQYQFTAMDGSTMLIGYGTAIRVLQVDGLLSLPEMKVKDQEREGAHGVTHGEQDYFSSRKLTFDLALEGSAAEHVEVLMDRFYSVFQPQAGEGTLVMKRSEKVKRRVDGRVRRAEFPANWDVRQGLAKGGLEIVCRDPRVYSDLLTTMVIPRPDTSGGRTYPLVYPRAYGGTITGGLGLFENLGNFHSPPIVRVYGPTNRPRVESVTDDRYVEYTGNLGATDVLEFDMDVHSMILNGTQSVRNLLDPTSDWWVLLKNVNNEIRFSALTADAGSKVEVDARSAWASG